MKKLVWMLALLAPMAHASMYKCAKDGAVSYQETPCDKSSTSMQTEVKLGSVMEGCYKPDHPSEPYELLEVRTMTKTTQGYREGLGYGPKETRVLRLLRRDKPEWEGSTLRTATPEEVDAAGTANQVSLRRGVAVDSGSSSYYYRRRFAQGIYEGKEAGSFYVLFNSEAGSAKKVPCT